MFKCHEVVTVIMECFARGLGLNEDFFNNVSCCQLERLLAVVCLMWLCCSLKHS